MQLLSEPLLLNDVSDAKPVVTAKTTHASPQQETALEPTAITALQERIKALAPARLEAFSKGFRTAFQVPDTQPSLAGLITTSRHQRWIEGFLAEVIEPSRMAT